jgi:hypothetical protein
MKTQMNADETQMKVLQKLSVDSGCAKRRHETHVLRYVHLRYICVHLRFQSPF